MARSSRPGSTCHPLLLALGERVRELRQGRGLTLKGLATRAGLSERFVSNLEAGRANISVLNLVEVASVLGTSAAELLEEGQASRQVISLLGLRGAGKTTVGKALAARRKVPFVELDRLVETEAGMGLSEIFALHGEEYYRQVELAALRRFLDSGTAAVLATGGGVVTSPEALDLLVRSTRTVWLRASPEEHWERVLEQGDLRPIRNRPHAMAELKRRLKEREPLYARAELTASTSGRTVPKVVAELSQALG